MTRDKTEVHCWEAQYKEGTILEEKMQQRGGAEGKCEARPKKNGMLEEPGRGRAPRAPSPHKCHQSQRGFWGPCHNSVD